MFPYADDHGNTLVTTPTAAAFTHLQQDPWLSTLDFDVMFKLLLHVGLFVARRLLRSRVRSLGLPRPVVGAIEAFV
jgi:hypothetical protein